PLAATWVFVLGYLAVWAAFGVVVYLASVAMAAAVASSMALADLAPYGVAIVLVAAGVYQWTPLKEVCLRVCQNPLGFLMTQWQLTGDYFENCNCDVVCPCLFSPSPPLTATPTQGACEVAFAFHVDQGRFGDVPLDGLNVAMIARSPGPMAQGNMAAALYLD